MKLRRSPERKGGPRLIGSRDGIQSGIHQTSTSRTNLIRRSINHPNHRCQRYWRRTSRRHVLTQQIILSLPIPDPNSPVQSDQSPNLMDLRLLAFDFAPPSCLQDMLYRNTWASGWRGWMGFPV